MIRHFVALAASEREDAQTRLEDDDLPAAERAAALRVVKLIGNPDHDWADWVRAGGRGGLPEFLHLVDGWLADPVDWQAMAWWPRGWSGQGQARSFFRSMDDDTLDALGVVIVEGEHPGSSDYAAELRQPAGNRLPITSRSTSSVPALQRVETARREKRLPGPLDIAKHEPAASADGDRLAVAGPAHRDAEIEAGRFGHRFDVGVADPSHRRIEPFALGVTGLQCVRDHDPQTVRPEMVHAFRPA